MSTRLAIIGCMAASVACGQGSFTGLGYLDPSHTQSTASDVADDGAVVGASGLGPGGAWCEPLENEAFISYEPGMMLGLGFLPSMSRKTSSAIAITADGMLVVGSSESDLASCNNAQAMTWTAAGGMQGFDFPAGAPVNGATAYGVSPDGGHIVGVTYAPGQDTYRACRWVDGASILLETLPSDHLAGNALDASLSGTIVGWFNLSPTPGTIPFVWSEGEMKGLPTEVDRPNGVALAITPDARVIVGHIFRIEAGLGKDHEAVVWARGRMRLLGRLPGDDYSSAWGVSADARLIVGTSGDAAEADCESNRAIVWTPATKMVPLEVYAAAHGITIPPGWTLLAARAISPNGRFIVGTGCNAGGMFEGYRIELP